MEDTSINERSYRSLVDAINERYQDLDIEHHHHQNESASSPDSSSCDSSMSSGEIEFFMCGYSPRKISN